MSVASQAGAWISELRIRRNTFGLATDLTGLIVSVESLSPFECGAIIQTFLTESELEFQNVTLVWSDTLISKVHSELIQLVCDDLQRLLSVELLEWRKLLSEATRRCLSVEEVDVLMTFPDGQTSKSAVMVDDYPGVQDGDAVMTAQQAQLLGHAFARQVTASRLRRSRSPQSSVGELEPNDRSTNRRGRACFRSHLRPRFSHTHRRMRRLEVSSVKSQAQVPGEVCQASALESFGQREVRMNPYRVQRAEAECREAARLDHRDVRLESELEHICHSQV
ncbi:hypothetical protein PHMEG_00020036 [Phytophthora megakarya]|uniref:Uncharacterized protein n=1 Tax=Phytophthora megakarya TaxID=4795 RepID=A0A225VR19_9STRA|nr:hypothetical protein PHMEG_00020036 [Phytophthora megakarya]